MIEKATSVLTNTAMHGHHLQPVIGPAGNRFVILSHAFLLVTIGPSHIPQAIQPSGSKDLSIAGRPNHS